jgi:hypothetical protein
MWHRRQLARLAVVIAAALLGARYLGAAAILLAREIIAGVEAPRAGPPDRDVVLPRARPAAGGAPLHSAPGAPATGLAVSPTASSGTAAGSLGAAVGVPPRRSEARIELDPISTRAGSRIATLSGFDPLGPRDLLLWRLDGGRAALMARGLSAPDGSLELPRVIVPRDGLLVVVSPAGSVPDAADASLPRSIAPDRPEPPQGEILEASTGGSWLRVRAHGSNGEILLARDDGVVFARYGLAATAAPGAPLFELLVELPATDSQVWLAHALPDGRLSEWSLAAPAPVEGTSAQ